MRSPGNEAEIRPSPGRLPEEVDRVHLAVLVIADHRHVSPLALGHLSGDAAQLAPPAVPLTRHVKVIPPDVDLHDLSLSDQNRVWHHTIPSNLVHYHHRLPKQLG
jgi:hypothetical protein